MMFIYCYSTRELAVFSKIHPIRHILLVKNVAKTILICVEFQALPLIKKKACSNLIDKRGQLYKILKRQFSIFFCILMTCHVDREIFHYRCLFFSFVDLVFTSSKKKKKKSMFFSRWRFREEKGKFFRFVSTKNSKTITRYVFNISILLVSKKGHHSFRWSITLVCLILINLCLSNIIQVVGNRLDTRTGE
jgi:hypothetical protein